jgi:hypothetical protein
MTSSPAGRTAAIRRSISRPSCRASSTPAAMRWRSRNSTPAGRCRPLAAALGQCRSARVEDGHDLFYRVRMRDNTQVTIPAEGVLHLKGMSLDGLIGISPIAYHRETIGLALAAEKYGASFFGNSAEPSGILKVKQVLGKEATEALRKSWEEKFKGPDAPIPWPSSTAKWTGRSRHGQLRRAVHRDPRSVEPGHLPHLSDAAAQGRRPRQGDVLQHRAAVASSTSPTASCPKWCAGSRRSTATS